MTNIQRIINELEELRTAFGQARDDYRQSRIDVAIAQLQECQEVKEEYKNAGLWQNTVDEALRQDFVVSLMERATGTDVHVDCGTELEVQETGPLFRCPECGVEVGVEERDKIECRGEYDE